MRKREAAFYALCVSILFSVGACGQTAVRPASRTLDKDLPRPSRIFLYNFAVSETEVSEYQGILRQQPSNRNPAERQREIARSASEALAFELAAKLRELGFTVDRVARGTSATHNDLLIDGQFLTVDEGNPLRRLVVGFGAGASKMDIRIQVYQGSQQRKLLDFTTHADSGKMPGAVATVPAGAAAPRSVSVGLAAGGAVTTGVNTNRSEVAQMTGSSAEQAVRYLSEFFAKQGWIRANQVKKARIAY